MRRMDAREASAVDLLRRVAPTSSLAALLADVPKGTVVACPFETDTVVSVITETVTSDGDLVSTMRSLERAARRTTATLEWIVTTACDADHDALRRGLPPRLAAITTFRACGPFDDAATALDNAATAAVGRWLVVLGRGDVLARDALTTFLRRAEAEAGTRWYLSRFDVVGARLRARLFGAPAFGSDRLFESDVRCGRLFAIRRDFYESLGGFDPVVAGAHEYDFALRAALVEYPGTIETRIVARIVRRAAQPRHPSPRRRIKAWLRARKGLPVDPPALERRSRTLDVLQRFLADLAGRPRRRRPSASPRNLKPLVFVVVATAEGGERLRRTLAALAREAASFTRILVLPTDGAVEIAADAGDLIVRRDGDLSRAMVAEIERLGVGDDPVVLVTLDTALYPGFVDHLVRRAASSDADVILRGANLRGHDGRIMAGPILLPPPLAFRDGARVPASAAIRARAFVAAARARPFAERPDEAFFAELHARGGEFLIDPAPVCEIDAAAVAHVACDDDAPAMTPKDAYRLLAAFDFADDMPWDARFTTASGRIARAVATVEGRRR